MLRPGDRLRHMRRSLAQLCFKPTLNALRAVAATASALRDAIIAACRDAVDSSSAANRHRDALHNAIGRPLARPRPGVVPVIGREVAADHERLHGCAVPGQVFCLVWDVCAIFPVVDDNLAEVAVAFVVGFVEGFGPLPTLTDAYVGQETLAMLVPSLASLIDLRSYLNLSIWRRRT